MSVNLPHPVAHRRFRAEIPKRPDRSQSIRMLSQPTRPPWRFPNFLGSNLLKKTVNPQIHPRKKTLRIYITHEAVPPPAATEVLGVDGIGTEIGPQSWQLARESISRLSEPDETFA